MRRLALLLLLMHTTLSAAEGRFLNPITDVCWECLFPITISGVNVTPGYKDHTKYNDRFCVCSGIPPKVGVPITFWEPAFMVDVTRHAYKLIGLGGVSIGKETVKNRGSVGIVADGPSQQSFYHVHWYKWPILAWLEILTDFACVSGGGLDVGYMSELDPLWNDEQLSIILDAEGALFANPAAQASCVADCVGSTAGKPIDKLFWCAGCNGSLYPFTGTVAHHQGGVQASALLVHRIIAKLHRSGLLKGYDKHQFCEAQYMPVIKKSLYKTQLAYPVAQTSGSCIPLGKSTLFWGGGKSYPNGGEDFVYIIWRKKQCCLDAITILSTSS